MFGSNYSVGSGWDIAGMRLPNGKVKVVRNKYGPIGEVFESDSEFYSKYRQFITERADSSNITCGIYDSING